MPKNVRVFGNVSKPSAETDTGTSARSKCSSREGNPKISWSDMGFKLRPAGVSFVCSVSDVSDRGNLEKSGWSSGQEYRNLKEWSTFGRHWNITLKETWDTSSVRSVRACLAKWRRSFFRCPRWINQ